MAYGNWQRDYPQLGTTIVDDGVPAVNNNTASEYTVRTGTITPNFGSYNERNTALLPVNPFTLNRNCYYPDVGDMLARSNSTKIQYTGASFGTIVQPMDQCPWPTSDYLIQLSNRSDAKILEKLRNSKVNLMQVFAERKRTADLIGSNAVKIADAIRAIRRGDVQTAQRVLSMRFTRSQRARFNTEYVRGDSGGAISRLWLEAQYGWRPLLQDCYGAMETLAAAQIKEVRERVGSELGYKEMETDSQKEFFPGLHVYRNTETCRMKQAVWFETSGAVLSSLKETGITNPASVGWEIMPWSFVVDWFIPVGTYINSWDATLGLSFKRGYKTSFIETKSKRSVYARGLQIYSGYAYHGWTRASRTRCQVIRSRLISFPGNPIPVFKNPFSFERAANAIALLSQLFAKAKL